MLLLDHLDDRRGLSNDRRIGIPQFTHPFEFLNGLIEAVDPHQEVTSIEDRLEVVLIPLQDIVRLVDRAHRIGCIVLKRPGQDRKSTRMHSSHVAISYAVFCLQTKTTW